MIELRRSSDCELLGTFLPGFLSYIPLIDFMFFVLYEGQCTMLHGMVGLL